MTPEHDSIGRHARCDTPDFASNYKVDNCSIYREQNDMRGTILAKGSPKYFHSFCFQDDSTLAGTNPGSIVTKQICSTFHSLMQISSHIFI